MYVNTKLVNSLYISNKIHAIIPKRNEESA